MNRTTNLLVATGLATALVAAACGDGAEFTVGDQPDIEIPIVSVTDVAADRDVLNSVSDDTVSLPDGWFEMAGYGTVLHVDGDEITPHHVTTSTCVTGESVDNELAVDQAHDDGVITVDLVGPTTDYRLLPLAGALTCDSDADDTLVALDELFRTHYPFLEQRDFDWQAAFADIEAAVAADPGAFEAALAKNLTELRDGHTTLDDLELDPDLSAFGLAGGATVDDLKTAVGHEFDRTLAGVDDIVADETGSVAWGRLDDDTGYLIMVAFEGIGGRDDDPVADRDALRAALDAAITDLADVEHLVIDMRFNAGGYEDLAATATGYFVDEETPAYRKWAHAQPDAFVQTVVVEPQGAFFDGMVAVVTSPITASAAEAFTLAMVEVADAAVVGVPSFGEFSDAIDWLLPNGTELTLSMENYSDLAGTNHEATGIPVDVPAPFDQAIEAAIGHFDATDTGE